MKAVVFVIALAGCWHFSGAGEQQPPQQAASSVPSDARRDAAGKPGARPTDAGVVSAGQDDFASLLDDEVGAQSTGGSLGGPGGPGQSGGLKGSGRPGPGWRRAPADAGVAAVPPGCVAGRVIALMIQGNQVVLTIAAGSTRGVTGSWTVTLRNQPQASVRILRSDKTITVVAVNGATLDGIRDAGIAVLCP